MSKSTLKTVVISFILFLLCSVFLISASADSIPGTIDSVLIDDTFEHIEISASISEDFVDANKDSSLYLFEILPNESISDLNLLTPIMQTYIDKSFSKNIDFKERMLYSSFLFAIKNEDGTYSPVSENKYVQNPEILSQNDMPYPERATKKGLCTQILSDAQYLGAAHTIISVEIEEYMSQSMREDTVAYNYLGQTFYFYQSKLSALDHKVKTLTDAGISVYFNIVLGKSGEGELDFLYIDKNSTNASLYAINTQSAQSSRYFMAFCKFIAERYSDENCENGFVCSYILGYEVNTTGLWNHISSVSFDTYVRYYENAYRILHSAVKSTYSDARVFISLSNLFNAEEGSSDFGARKFIEAFSQNIKARGDIGWSLAINPYASDPSNTEFWNDEFATDSIDSPYLTMKNLSVLTELMNTEPLLYDGKVRHIIISEFGIHGNYNDARSNDCQAGAYALAYAIADQNKDIDAFIYYRHVDYPAEPVHLGLWTSHALSPLNPENKKSIYDIFRNADTEKAQAGLDMARAFCTDEVYTKLVGEYKVKPKRSVIEAVPVAPADVPSTFKKNVLFDFSKGSLYNFYPSDSSAFVELRPISESEYTSYLYSKQNLSSTKTYSGISKELSGISAERSEYISLSLKSVTPNPQTVTVMLRLDNNGHSFEGIVQLTSNEDSEITFKIADYLKATDGELGTMKLLYKPSSESVEAGEYGLWLKNVTLYEKTGLSTAITVIITLITVIIILALCAAIIILKYHKPLQNRLKAIIGKTKSKIIGFLKDKKIISRRRKKKKGARITPPSKVPANQVKHNNPGRVYNQPERPRIVNGRVIPGARNQVPNINSSLNKRAYNSNQVKKEDK